MLIKIWCHDSEGHNGGLSFQSENLNRTTAEEPNLPVNHSKMLILWGPESLWRGSYHEHFLSNHRKLQHLWCHSTPLCFLQLPFTLCMFVVWLFLMIWQQIQCLAKHNTHNISVFCDPLVIFEFTTHTIVLKRHMSCNLIPRLFSEQTFVLKPVAWLNMS